jgi:hypothetical protein
MLNRREAAAHPQRHINMEELEEPARDRRAGRRRHCGALTQPLAQDATDIEEDRSAYRFIG